MSNIWDNPYGKSSSKTAEWGNITGNISSQTDLQGELTNKIDASEKAQANGVATLDGAGKVPQSQLTIDAVTYKGGWDASTNTPTLTSGTGDNGDLYYVTVAGTTSLDGINEWAIGDAAIFNASLSQWQKLDNSKTQAEVLADVEKVNNATGWQQSGGTTSKTLTVSENSTIDQDLQQSASPTFSNINLPALADGNLSVSGGLLQSGAYPTVNWGDIAGTLSNQTDLQNALNSKANDTDVVKLTGDQSVAGVKTFTDYFRVINGTHDPFSGDHLAYVWTEPTNAAANQTALTAELYAKNTSGATNARNYQGVYGSSGTHADDVGAYSGRFIAVQGQINHEGSGTMALCRTNAAVTVSSGGGTVTTGYGFYALAAATNGNITDYYGGIVDTPIISGSGSIENNVGYCVAEREGGTKNVNLLLGTKTIPTGDWSIYNSSTKPNYIEGNVGIGTTNPTQKLDVNGTVNATNFTGDGSTLTGIVPLGYDPFQSFGFISAIAPAGGNGSASAPFNTIQAALDNAGSGAASVYYIAPGTYTENLVFPAGSVTKLIAVGSEQESFGGSLSSVEVNGTALITTGGHVIDGVKFTGLVTLQDTGTTLDGFHNCTLDSGYVVTGATDANLVLINCKITGHMIHDSSINTFNVHYENCIGDLVSGLRCVTDIGLIYIKGCSRFHYIDCAEVAGVGCGNLYIDGLQSVGKNPVGNAAIKYRGQGGGSGTGYCTLAGNVSLLLDQTAILNIDTNILVDGGSVLYNTIQPNIINALTKVAPSAL